MRTHERNKMMMYETVLHVIEQNQVSWGTIPAYNDVFTRLSEALLALKESAAAQNEMIKGATITKNKAKVEAVSLAIRLSGLITAYARKVKNEELFVTVKRAKSSWLQTSDGKR